MPSGSLASPMLSVDARIRVPSNRRSHSSMASHRSSRGERFQRSQVRHTTQRRPFEESNASRRPTGKCSIASLAPSGEWQKRQVLYMRCSRSSRCSRCSRCDRHSLEHLEHVEHLEHLYSSFASSVIGTFPLKACDTGQPSLVPCASLSNVAASTLGTLPRTVRCILVILKPSPTLSIVQATSVAMRVGGVPFFSSPRLRAML